jgi:Lon protease-like protein
VVLFPDVFLPLHIFEPRYREMVHDALNADRLIGMVLLREGWNREADVNPPIYPTGCAGLITHVERLADGQYNIVLRGFERFRVRDEEHSRAYRLATVDALPDTMDPDARPRLRTARQRLETLLERRLTETGSETTATREMADGDLVNALAQYLEFDPVEKLALLERAGVVARCEALIDLLEMRLLLAAQALPTTGVQ